VVKQARPALERFPEYRVSTQRIAFEARFYQTVAPFDRGGVCPRVHRFDAARKALVLEDLGGAEPLDRRLARGGDATAAVAALGAFLGSVHAGTRGAELGKDFDNREMRRLHGEHVFELPFRDNDFPLTAALRRRAREIAAERELVRRIDAAGARYHASAIALVHGDVQPTNVLLTERGPKLLDAEIAHLGDPAFDVGQLAGHLWLRAAARGAPEEAAPAVRALWEAYAAALGGALAVELADCLVYAGIEMLRRTLGAARVPEASRDEAALRVVDAGRRFVLAPPARPDLL
jgi:5-methylthioribose kinase